MDTYTYIFLNNKQVHVYILMLGMSVSGNYQG